MRNIIGCILVALLLMACETDYSPKPVAYLRIDLPDSITYKKTETECPWVSEIPEKSFLIGSTDKKAAKGDCWKTWVYPKHKAEVYLTYKKINEENSLRELLDNMHQLSYEHQVKANRIRTSNKYDEEQKKLSLIYEIDGDVASSIQFCLTDSTKNYLRGALYFRSKPNADSIAPVLAMLKKDIHHFMDELEWQE